MVLSVFAGPATAALSPGPGSAETAQTSAPPPTSTATSEAQSVSTTDTLSNQVVPDGELVSAGENVSIWQGSILTLRASDLENDQSRDVRLDIPQTNVELSDSGDSASLRKDPLYIYRRGETVTYQFDGNYANNGDVIQDEKVQVVTAHLKKDAGTPQSFTDVSNLLTNNDDVEASVIANFTGDSNANYGNFTPSKSGQYVVAVVAVNNASKQGFTDTNNDGNLEATSDVTIVGFDYLPIHEERSTVEVPDAAATGSTVSVAVDSGNAIDSDNVSHTVLVYNETVLDAQEETIVANGTGIEEVRTTVEYVNGTRDIAAGTNIAGISPGQSTYTGSTSAADVINRLLGSQGQNVNVTGNTTLHVAAASTVGGPRENVSLRLTDEFPEGDYQLLHIATARDGEQTVSNKQPISLSAGVELNITANQTDVVTGSPVELTVTRADTTDPVDATVTFDGQELSTGSDGTVVVDAPTETGTFTATATKAPEGGDVFVSDSVDITVSTPATIEYSNLSVSPRTVQTDETVTVNVTVENTGQTEGVYNASLLVGGTATGAEQNGTLAPDESTRLSFQTSFAKPGARQLTVADLASQRVRVLAPAAFDPGNVEASPLVNVSEQFRVSLPVNNTGDVGGTFYANLTVRNESGAIVASRNRSVFLNGGQSRTVRFSRVAVREGNLTATITGTPAESTSPDDEVRVVSPDVQPPSIVLESPSQGETPYGVSINLNVTDADSSVRSVTTQFNDGQVQSQTPGEVSLNTTGLTEGTNTLNVTATDDNGNTARETYTFDFVSAPRIVSVSPTGAAGTSPKIVVRYADDSAGDAETGIDADATRVFVNGNPVDAANLTSNQTTLVAEPAPENLTTDTNTVRVEVTDNAGHTTLRRFSFGRDTTPPTVTIDSDTITSVGVNDPAELNLTADDPNLKRTTLLVVNTSTDEVVYTQNVTAVARSTGGIFQAQWDARDDQGNPVADGSYAIVLSAVDTAGNSNNTAVTTVVDNTAPVYTFSSLSDSDGDTVDASADTTLITNDTTLTVDYTVSEDVDLTYRVTPVRSGGIVTTPETNADAGAGTSQLDLSSLSDGRYRVTALVNDETDNTNRTTATAVVEIDRTRPTLGATLRLTNNNQELLANVTSDEPLADTPTVNVNTPSGSETLTLTQVGDSQVYQGTLQTTETGSYELTATGVDRAGNTRTATASTKLDLTDIGENQNITILGPNTFVFIETNKTNIQGGVSDVTLRLSETESLGNERVFSGRNAERFLQAEVGGLSDDQIDRVTYGFKKETVPSRLRTARNTGVNILYLPADGGAEFLSTQLETDPISDAPGDYYVAEREGLSDYAIYTKDSEAPEITFDTPDSNPASFPADTTSVDISASVTDNVALNESNITVTFDDGSGTTDVTQEANIVNNSVEDKDVQYTATGLSPGDYTFTITAPDQNRTTNVDTSSLDFTVQSDDTAPNVTGPNPSGELAYGTSQVEISADYEDGESGIDEDNVSIVFDGTDITDSATVTGSKVSQTVSVDNGTTYTVNVSVPNTLGDVTTKNTTFTVAGDGQAPTVTFDTPSEGQEFNTGTQNVTLEASVTDAGGSGLDENSIEVYFDGVEKTADASVSNPDSVTYTTPDLESGSRHSFTIVAADNAGTVTTETRNFTIDSDGQIPSITRVSSAGETLRSGEDLDLEVNYTDDESGIDPTSVVLEVNGTDYTDQATVTSTGASVTVPAESLSAGEQSVVVSVSDNASNTNTLTTTFGVAEGPDLTVEDIHVNDSTVLTDEAVAVNVTIANFGDEAGSKTFAVSSGSATPESAEVTNLGPRGTTFKEFTVSFDEPGDVDVAVNGTTGPTVSVQSRTANFVLANQSVTTSVVSGNETTVVATVQNTGSKTGTIEVLTANGDVLDATSVTLKPSQTRKLKFTQKLEATGSDRTVTYAFGDLTIGTTTVTPTQPTFQVVSDTIAPGTVTTGQTVTVTVRVRNNGGQPGSFQSALAADGNSRVTNATTIANGATRTLTYKLSFDNSGTYRLTLGRFVLGNVTVNEPRTVDDSPSASSGGGGGGGGAIGARSLVGKTSFLGGGQNIGISFGPASRGVDRVDVEFSEATAGQVKISELDRPPADTDYSRNYDRTVVSVLDIQVPSSQTNNPATLTISVKQSRLSEMGVTPDQLQVERYNDGEWQTLESQVVETNGQTVRIRVETPGFSLFAVTTKSAQTTPTAQPSGPSSPTDTATPTGDEPATRTGTATLEGDTTPPGESTSTQFPGFGVALTLVALLAAVALLARRRD